ncbi:MAG: ABC transporter permease [Planctomycetota bacterium]|nr:ABC transporter permease [Planctomycetota bacterium]
MRLKLLPWEYGIRNLMRRPTRTALTLSALTVVILLVFVVVGFIRGLEISLAVSGDPSVVLVYSVSAEDNVENSSIAASTPSLLKASLDGVQRRFGVDYISPELYMGTRIQTGEDKIPGLGLIRGVTPAAPLVRRGVRLVEGSWPGPNEVMVGKLVAAKLGCDHADVAVGQSVWIEKQPWTISGRFTAEGSALESEIWCRLPDFQQALKRQDLSLVAMMLTSEASSTDVDIFCKSRTDLEIQAIGETAYYETLQQHYKPMRILAWVIVLLVAGAGVFSGLNMMYGAIAGRTREIATLQAVGYRQRAILVSIIQEGTLLAAAGSLLAGVVALIFLNGLAVRFTMGAFTLRIDGVSLIIGCGVGLLLGVVGALPPAIKALRASVAVSLKAI